MSRCVRLLSVVAGLLCGPSLVHAQTGSACPVGTLTVHTWSGELDPGVPLAPSSAEEVFTLNGNCRYGSLQVRIDWASPANDLDLELRDPSGASATSANFQVEGPGEAVSLANAAAGTYIAVVTGFLTAPTSFQGMAEVEVLGLADGTGSGGSGEETGGDGGETTTGEEGEPRVVVAVIDSAINPYHEFFYQQPVRVTEALLEAFEVPPSRRITLTRTGNAAADIAADAAFWNQVERGKSYYFVGTNLIVRSEAGATFAPLMPTASKSPHGVGVTSAVLTANPDAIILFIETEGALGNDAAQSYAFQHPEVDLINTSYGFQVPQIGVPLPLPLTYSFSFEGVVERGKLHFSAAGNGIGITALDPGAGAWWGIGVSGIEEYSSEGDTAVFSSNVADFVADFTQDLPYCMVCASGTDPFVAGTSFSSPQAAGVASRVILEARRLVGHEGGIRTDGSAPLMIKGAGFEISNWFVRRALEQAARIPSALDYDPVNGVFDLGSVPVNPVAPWLQIGWGDLSYNPAYGVVDAALSHLNLKPARFARSKSADYCEFQSGVMDFRFEYWNAIDGLNVDANPIVYCESVLGLRESNDPGGTPQDTDGDDTVDALDACPTDASNACVTQNAVPVARDQAISTGFETAVSIVLMADDADGDALSYRIVTAPGQGSLSAVQGDVVLYTPAAGYSGPDSFRFVANDGTADSAPATVSITVAEAMSTTLDARLVATHQGQPIDPERSYDAPLAVRLDAGSSTVPAGRQIASVTFHLGDNSTVTQNCATVETCRVFNTTYAFAGRYEPFVVITDSSGQRDTSDPLLIKTRVTVTADPADPEDPDTSRTVAQLILRDANGTASTAIRGQVPLTVTMDGSNSVAANGRSITGYRFDFGDGRIVTTTEPTATHVYETPGAYEPSLTVTDSSGATSTSKAAVAVNPANSGGGGGSTGDGGGTGGGSTGGDSGTGGGIVTPPGGGSQPLVVRQQGGGAIGGLALWMLGGGWLLRRRVSRVAR